jgi:polysaccharide export outer membrane protein
MRRIPLCLGVLALAACAARPELPPATSDTAAVAPDYIIGPLDSVSVFVWGNPELTTSTTIRPDGKVTLPLVEDLPAAGKTSFQLARDIERELKDYVLDPIVTVTVGNYVGDFSQQIRVVGAAAQPQAIPYRANMTILDVMIAVGGLSEFAAGDRTTLIRRVGGEEKSYRVRLANLLKDGDVTANVRMQPGDVIIIPESWF